MQINPHMNESYNAKTGTWIKKYPEYPSPLTQIKLPTDAEIKAALEELKKPKSKGIKTFLNSLMHYFKRFKK